ncbi:unnamed protein product [Prorocentrum cordatum]|uniref:Aspartic peptidase DDI1-type domain-containing protein n=1 Tax=Prorocentrum cordatum TaxID=2364126 RepID=A0ABN9RG72_9DINO|nr:unnamed protein product [Polarella glacialis]
MQLEKLPEAWGPSNFEVARAAIRAQMEAVRAQLAGALGGAGWRAAVVDCEKGSLRVVAFYSVTYVTSDGDVKGSRNIVTTTVYIVAIAIDDHNVKWCDCDWRSCWRLSSTPIGRPIMGRRARQAAGVQVRRRALQKSYKMQDRYVVGPQLVRALGARTRRLAQACPDIDKIDEVTDEGKLTGWQRVFDFLLSKLDLSNVNETGNSADKFFNELQREPGEGFPDWTARWEAHERDLLSQLKAVDSSVEEVIAAPLRTWWYLRRSRLSPVARGEITATAGGGYDFGGTHKPLCTRYPREALKEIDGVREKKGRRAGFFGEAEEAEQEDHDFEDRSEIADIVDQLVNLADEEDSTLFEEFELVDDYEDGIYAEFRQLGRHFKDARDLIRKLKFGHQAKDCPERTKDRGKPQYNEMTSFALLELGDLVLLLDDVGGVWAILDCGATRSLIGVTMAEHLIYDMEEKHSLLLDVVERTRYFTFDGGRRKSSMGTMTGAIFLGDGHEKIEISIMDNEVPLLIGMDVLGPDHTNALIDCGNGYLMLPKISHHVFQCRKMPSGHLAINVTTPTRWQNIPQSFPNIVGITQCSALEDEAKTSAVADEAALALAPAAGAGASS